MEDALHGESDSTHDVLDVARPAFCQNGCLSLLHQLQLPPGCPRHDLEQSLWENIFRN